MGPHTHLTATWHYPLTLLFPCFPFFSWHFTKREPFSSITSFIYQSLSLSLPLSLPLPLSLKSFFTSFSTFCFQRYYLWKHLISFKSFTLPSLTPTHTQRLNLIHTILHSICPCFLLSPPFSPQTPQKQAISTITTPPLPLSSLHSFCKMGLSKRPAALLLWLFLLFFFIAGHCHGSRSSQVFKLKPRSHNSGHFLGFLPRALPIPASGPSRKHNDIGLQSWRSPWSPLAETFFSPFFWTKGDMGFVSFSYYNNQALMGTVNGVVVFIFWAFMTRVCFKRCYIWVCVVVSSILVEMINWLV